jgi:hypothetical protein
MHAVMSASDHVETVRECMAVMSANDRVETVHECMQ